MEEDAPRECANLQCINLRQNMIILNQHRQRLMAEQANTELLQREKEHAQIRLHDCERIITQMMEERDHILHENQMLREQASRAEEGVEYYKKRYEDVLPKEAESNKHLKSANEWRDKYDTMGALAEQLEAKLEETQQKYVSTINILDKLQKKSSQQKTQLEAAQRHATELNDQRKNLNKYLKNVVFLVDNLSTTANLSKHPRRIKELVETFRRDDVRAYFNAPIYRNSTARSIPMDDDEEGDVDEADNGAEASSSGAAPINDLGLTLSDDEDEEHVNAIEKFMNVSESINNAPPPPRPNLGSKLEELKAKRRTVEHVDVKKVNNWPKGIRKPHAAPRGDERDYGIINPRTVHSKTIPVHKSNIHDFDSLNNAAMERKKALLVRGDGEEVGGKAPIVSTATIHGRKGKTVAEQQSEMMKVSVKEKVAMMKAMADGLKSPEKAKQPTKTALGLELSPSPSKQKSGLVKERETTSFTLSEASEVPENLEDQSLNDLDNDVAFDDPSMDNDETIEMEAPVIVRTPSSRASAFQANIRNSRSLSRSGRKTSPSVPSVPKSSTQNSANRQSSGKSPSVPSVSRSSTARSSRSSSVAAPSISCSKSVCEKTPKTLKTPAKAKKVVANNEEIVVTPPTREERAKLRSLRFSSAESNDEQEEEKDNENKTRKSRKEMFEKKSAQEAENDGFRMMRKHIDTTLILEESRRRSSTSVANTEPSSSQKPVPTPTEVKKPRQLPKRNVPLTPNLRTSRSSSVASNVSELSVARSERITRSKVSDFDEERVKSISQSVSKTSTSTKPAPKTPALTSRESRAANRNSNSATSSRASSVVSTVSTSTSTKPTPKTPVLTSRESRAANRNSNSATSSRASSVVSTVSTSTSTKPAPKTPALTSRESRAANRNSNSATSSRASSVVSTRSVRNTTKLQTVASLSDHKIGTSTPLRASLRIQSIPPSPVELPPPKPQKPEVKKKAVAKLDANAGGAPMRVKTAPVKQKGQTNLKRKLEKEVENEEASKRVTRSQQGTSESDDLVGKILESTKKIIPVPQRFSTNDSLDTVDSNDSKDPDYEVEEGKSWKRMASEKAPNTANKMMNVCKEVNKTTEMMVDEENLIGRRHSARLVGGGASVTESEEDLLEKNLQSIAPAALDNVGEDHGFSSDEEDQLRIEDSDDEIEVRLSIDVEPEEPVVKKPMVVVESDLPEIELGESAKTTVPINVGANGEVVTANSSEDSTTGKGEVVSEAVSETVLEVVPVTAPEVEVADVQIQEEPEPSSPSSEVLTIQEDVTPGEVAKKDSSQKPVPELESVEEPVVVQKVPTPETVAKPVEKVVAVETKEVEREPARKKPALTVAERQEQLGLIMSDSDSDSDDDEKEGEEEDLKMIDIPKKMNENKKDEVKKKAPPRKAVPRVGIAVKPKDINALPATATGKKKPVTKLPSIVKPLPAPSASSSDASISTPSTEPAAKKAAILIEPIGKGKRGLSAAAAAKKAIGLKDQKKMKKAGGARAQFRQALDLKLPVQELKRPMEEKGFMLDGSIPLTAEEAVDVMIEFLKENSPSDMWMVLLRHKIDGNIAPLINNDEQNFLNVSVSLNDDDQNLLRLFIIRILFEFATRDSFNATQSGCYTRLMCHAVRFVEVEDEEMKVEWMKKLVKILVLKNEANAIKCIAYCLNSDASEFLRWLVEDLDEDTDSSLVFRSLMHMDSEQAGVVNWLLSIKFQTPYISAPKENEVANRAKMYFDKYCNQMNLMVEDENVTIEPDAFKFLEKSIQLAKTGDPGLLQLIFDEMKGVLGKLENQFNEDESRKNIPRSIFDLPSSASTITTGDGKEILLKFDWLKSMMLIFLENSNSSLRKTIIAALTEISVQIVRIKACVNSKDIEKIDRNGRVPVRQSILGMCTFLSQFTNFPLEKGAAVEA